MRNCLNCLYSNKMKNGDIMCDKKLLIDNKKIVIKKEKAKLSCPAHSSALIEETRYMRNNQYVHENEEYCDICKREVNLDDINQYAYIEIKDEGGNTIDVKMQCKICREKGRR